MGRKIIGIVWEPILTTKGKTRQGRSSGKIGRHYLSWIDISIRHANIVNYLIWCTGKETSFLSFFYPHPKPFPHCFFKDFIYLFLERGERREKGRERNINVWLPLAHPLPETWPATQAYALTGNQTSDPLVCRPALNSLSHISQGIPIAFRETEKYQLVASYLHPDQGSNPQPRYVPQLWIELTTFHCTGWCSNKLSHMGQGHSIISTWCSCQSA